MVKVLFPDEKRRWRKIIPRGDNMNRIYEIIESFNDIMDIALYIERFCDRFTNAGQMDKARLAEKTVAAVSKSDTLKKAKEIAYEFIKKVIIPIRDELQQIEMFS